MDIYGTEDKFPEFIKNSSLSKGFITIKFKNRMFTALPFLIQIFVIIMYTQIPLNSSSAIIGYKHLEVGS